MELQEIQRRSRFGPAIMMGRRAFAVVVGLLTTVIMPHFLSPKDYGLATMSTIVFTFGGLFKDFGLGAALLRKGHVDPEEINFLFWFNIASTIFISVILALTAPITATFFHQPIVSTIILASLVGFAVSGFTMQHRAILNRNLRFADLAVIDSVSLMLQFVVTLVLAIDKLGVWAIVAGNVCYNLINGLLCVFRERWMPARPSLIPQMRALLAFGANSSVHALAVLVSTNITALLIGNTQTVESLGQYNRANAFLSLPLNNLVDPLTQATLPVLARLRPFPEEYRSLYLSFLQRLNLLVIPSAAFLLLAGGPLVETILGTRWREAGELLSILAPVVGVLGFYPVLDLFITQDRTAELRTIGLLEMVIRSGAVFLGIQFGLYTAAASYTAATFIALILRIAIAGRTGPVTVMDHVRTALPSIPICAGVSLGCVGGYFIAEKLDFDRIMTTAIVTGLAAILGLICLWLFASSRDVAKSFLRSLRPSAVQPSV
jgi:polysaccharide transporter, PST family